MRLWTALIAVVLFVTTSSIARAGNSIPNGTLDKPGLPAGWTSLGLTMTWVSADAAGNQATSGSMNLSNPTGNFNGAANYCVTGVSAGTAYDFGGDMFTASGQVTGSRAIMVVFFDDPSCSTGNQLGFPAAVGPALAFDAWQSYKAANVVAPAGTQSARFMLIVNNAIAGAPSPFVTRFDNLYFAPSVPAVAPTITSGAPAAAVTTVLYTHTFTATGGPLVTFKVTSGALPPSFLLYPGGVLSGTEVTAGDYAFQITASNGIAPDAVQAVTLTVLAAPVFTSPQPPSHGDVGTAYTHTFTASGTAPITFAVSGGALPPGLTLSSGGALTGTPTTNGSFSAVVTASNPTGKDATQGFIIKIGTAPVVTGAPPAGTVGTAYTHTFTASGSAPITYTLTSGSLPPGVTLSPAGSLSGTPTAAGSYGATITASNGALPNAVVNITITINPAVTPPPDAGAPKDSGAPPIDSGAPGADASSPDSGGPIEDDAGPDATGGTPPSSSGTGTSSSSSSSSGSGSPVSSSSGGATSSSGAPAQDGGAAGAAPAPEDDGCNATGSAPGALGYLSVLAFVLARCRRRRR
jgi:hypothetical protein